MNVKELRDVLNGLPDDMPVILQKDSEGNGYSPLSGADADNVGYVAETPWSGETKYLKLTDALKARGFAEEDISSNATPCVVLYPTN